MFAIPLKMRSNGSFTVSYDLDCLIMMKNAAFKTDLLTLYAYDAIV